MEPKTAARKFGHKLQFFSCRIHFHRIDRQFSKGQLFKSHQNRCEIRHQIVVCPNHDSIPMIWTNECRNAVPKRYFAWKKSSRTQVWIQTKLFTVCGVVISFYVVQLLVLTSNCTHFMFLCRNRYARQRGVSSIKKYAYKHRCDVARVCGNGVDILIMMCKHLYFWFCFVIID